jgi:hypothetical protein
MTAPFVETPSDAINELVDAMLSRVSHRRTAEWVRPPVE